MRVRGKLGALCVAAGATLLMAACVPDTGGGGGGPTNLAPTASFTFSPNNTYAPVTVNFNGSASTDDGGIVDYSWSFGDGSPNVNGPTATTSHTYTGGGSFPVTLTVKDAQGLTGSTSLTVTALAHVDADGDGFFGDVNDCNDNDNTVYPGAPDTFGDGIDQNCDTVDGAATTVIFVSKNGNDTPPIGDAACGLAPTTACRQISTGLSAAVSQSRPNVYVSGGSFNAFTMANGISVYGNFGSANWKRGGAASGDAATVVNAATNAAVGGGTVGVIASNITAPTVIDGLTVAGATAAAGTAPHGIVATGGRDGVPTFERTKAATVLSAAAVLDDPGSLPTGAVLVWDPIGGPVGVGVAEVLAGAGREVHLATPDWIVGNELARAGDLGPANARLSQAGVVFHKRCRLAAVRKGVAVLDDRFSDATVELEVAAVVDAGHRLPDDELHHLVRDGLGHRLLHAGDSVAPRTVFEAILEGRRRALELG